jgi:hypothetical protein
MALQSEAREEEKSESMEERHSRMSALFTPHHIQARGVACLVDQMNLYNISNPPPTLFSQCNFLQDNRPFTHTAPYTIFSTLQLHHSPIRQTPSNFVLLDSNSLATKHADFCRPQRRFTIITSFSFDKLLTLQHARLCDRHAGVSRQTLWASPLSMVSVFHIPLMQISAR